MNMDPVMVDPAEVDALNCRFICKHSDCRMVSPYSMPFLLDFRGAIDHSVHEHSDLPFEYDIASKDDVQCAMNIEMRNPSGIYNWGVWGCGHCSLNFGENDTQRWVTHSTVVKHIREAHGVVDPAEHTDYYFNHRICRPPSATVLQTFEA
ncbi:hypothetical protein OF83DRAFT_145315 [Amylostereum chailletii]|nr:hypothetical protein OF83DRAFT_145315 [Amylostereum chailletii]